MSTRMFAAMLLLAGCSAPAAGDPSQVEPQPQTEDPSGSSAADDQADEGDEDDEAEVAKGPLQIPTECAKKKGDICFASNAWIRALCAKDLPTVALHMFAEGTPWTRAYVAQPTKAWSAMGIATDEIMPADEEVVVLRHRKPKKTEFQVSGVTDAYDAVRWDGLCITLEPHQIRFDDPPKRLNARLIWKRLERDTRAVLKKDEVLRPIYLDYKKACKGVTMGQVSKECERLDTKLSETIAARVRDGLELPTPNMLPEVP